MLTARQAEVVRRVGSGQSPQVAAGEMGISYQTIKQHIYAVRSKYQFFDVWGNVAMTAIAIHEGLLSAEELRSKVRRLQ